MEKKEFFELSEVVLSLCRSVAAGPLCPQPVPSMPAGEVLKMGLEIVGAPRGEFGVFGDVTVVLIPVPKTGSWF